MKSIRKLPSMTDLKAQLVYALAESDEDNMYRWDLVDEVDGRNDKEVKMALIELEEEDTLKRTMADKVTLHLDKDEEQLKQLLEKMKNTSYIKHPDAYRNQEIWAFEIEERVLDNG